MGCDGGGDRAAGRVGAGRGSTEAPSCGGGSWRRPCGLLDIVGRAEQTRVGIRSGGEGSDMRRLRVSVRFALALGSLMAVAAPAAGEVRVTNDNHAMTSYLRYDGSSDATTQACSNDRRATNEPTIAIDPRSPNVVVSGSNDYCTQVTNPDVWAGY